MTTEFYARAMTRIQRLILGIGMIGTVYASLRLGIRAGSGFAIGVLMSLFSFHTFRGVAESLGGPENRRAAAFASLFVIRFGLIGAAIYVIVRYLEVSLMALLAGLFASAAAVLVEIIYELGFTK
jgi:ATP synthase I chain